MEGKKEASLAQKRGRNGGKVERRRREKIIVIATPLPLRHIAKSDELPRVS